MYYIQPLLLLIDMISYPITRIMYIIYDSIAFGCCAPEPARAGKRQGEASSGFLAVSGTRTTISWWRAARKDPRRQL